MRAAERPPEPTPDKRPQGELQASQRIARGTLARSIGELIAKPASLVFFVVIARGLGEERFGDFIFGLSLSMLLMVLAGMGLQELVAREVARNRRRVDELFWDVFVLKGLLLMVLIAAIAAILLLQDYDAEAFVAILIVSLGIGFEYQVRTFSAVFQAFETQQHIATALVINRLATMVMGIVVVVAGGGLVPVAIVFTLGSALGLIASWWLMRGRVARPAFRVERSGWLPLIRSGIPFGVMEILTVAALRSSVVLLGLLTVDSGEVGEYGAAFRLIEALMFISWSFSSAVMPWFSRDASPGTISISRAFEVSLKSVIAVMLPLGLSLALFAEPIIELLYGEEFAGAITPLRILGAMTVLWGINGVISAVLVGRNRPRLFTGPALAAVAVTLVLAAILIPPHGALGAALATVPSAALLAVLTVTTTARMLGRISPLRVFSPPALAGGVMAAAAVLLGGAPWFVAAAVAAALYGLAFLAIERLLFPADFSYYATIARAFRRRVATSA